MKLSLELTKEALVDEFKSAPYVCDNPLGNAASNRKIQEYLIACVDAEDANMWDWFETNIIEKFHVKGVDRSMFEFASEVLTRSKQNDLLTN